MNNQILTVSEEKNLNKNTQQHLLANAQDNMYCLG